MADDLDEMDMEDINMDEISIPLPLLGHNTQGTEKKTLTLNKAVSFGPSQENQNQERVLNSPAAMIKSKNNMFGIGSAKQSIKGTSIASFLQNKIRPSTLKDINSLSASATAFLGGNSFTMKNNK